VTTGGRSALAVALSAPLLRLTLTQPVTARGLLRLQRSVTRIPLYLDDPEKPRAALDL
jgi:hypothetical protein